MKFISRRPIIAAMLCLMCAHVIAAVTFFETTLSDPSRLDDIIIIAAFLLSSVALLLRRQRNWRNEIKHLHAKLSTEQTLRVNAEKTLLTISSHLRETILENQVDECARINSICCKLDAEKNALQAASSHFAEKILFRILQESLPNISLHAQATEVKTALHLDPEHLSMTVRDNGIGMLTGLVQLGCGLHGIQDRIDAAGALFDIDSKPSLGTSLSMSIPLSK